MLFLLKRMRKRRYVRITNIRNAAIQCVFWLVVISCVHIASMILFEDMSWGDAVWFTFVTLPTVGFGDFSPESGIGRTSTVVLLFGIGIGLFAELLGYRAEYKFQRRELQRQGLWEWKLKNHILVISLPSKGGKRYLKAFAKEFAAHESFTGVDVDLLAPHLPFDEMPDFLIDQGVHFSKGVGTSLEDLQRVNAHLAQKILILCPDPDMDGADDMTASVIRRLREQMGVTCTIVAEYAAEENEVYLKSSGATAVTKSTNDYPAIALNALVVPGSETIIEGVLQQRKGAQLKSIPNDMGENVAWLDLATQFLRQKMTLLGYVDSHGQAHELAMDEDVIEDAAHFIVLVAKSKAVQQFPQRVTA